MAGTPTLGNYPDTSLALSANTTVRPDAAPTNVTSMNVSTSTNFNGRLEGSPLDGVVRITDAHPAGTYTVTVIAFNGAGPATMKTFTLTVRAPATCDTISFSVAANLGAGTNPYSVAVGDFNSDGEQDLAVAGVTGVSILLGDGAGNFSAPIKFGAGTPLRSVAVGDFNGDGKQDLAVAGGKGVSILLGDGAGKFSAPTNFPVGIFPFSVAVGDFNGDGKQDLVTANYLSDNVSILLGDGAGNFTSPTDYFAGADLRSVAVGDFDEDGNQDLAVAHDSLTVSILLGVGAGKFSGPTDYFAGTNPFSVAVGDFNGDGNQDLAVANQGSNNVSILLGDGAGNFFGPSFFDAAFGSRSVAVGDFDGDGEQDLAVAGAPGASILLGDGAGNFSGPTSFGTGGVLPFSVAVGDFNSDGKQDLAVANKDSNNVSILLNICAPIPAQPRNLSTRLRVLTDGDVGIGGLIIIGSVPKTVVLRGIGPSLASFNVPNPLADPVLELHGPPGFTTITNDNWMENPQAQEIQSLGLAPTNNLESAILATLSPGNYTGILKGNNNGVGVALVEIWDVDQPAASKLGNISTRGFVATGDDIMIAGIILNGNTAQDIVVRGIGPSLGILNTLANPILELRDNSGTLIRANDDWMDDPAQAALIQAAGLAPPNPLESAIYQTLAPGLYTSLLSGVNNGTGVGLVETYDLLTSGPTSPATRNEPNLMFR